MGTREAEGVTIRTADPADWPAIRALLAAAGLPTNGLAGSYRLFVAARAGRIVGTAALERHGDGADTAYLLRSVAVDPGARCSGLGARLVARALGEARGEAPVALLTETAAGYFPRFGFIPVDRAQLPATLSSSAELRGACPDSARALLRRGPAAGLPPDRSGHGSGGKDAQR
jgi:amino-acid N-acetyltransferase